MTFLPKKPLFRRLSIALGIIVLCLGLYSLAGFVILPKVGKAKLPEVLREVLNRNASVGEIRLNPFTFQVLVSNFTVAGRGDVDEFVSFDSLSVNMEAWESLFSGALTLSEFTLEAPLVTLTRQADGRLNFDDLLEPDNATASAPRGEEEETDFSFYCGNIHLNGGHIILDDRQKGVEIVSREINLKIPSISNIAENRTRNAGIALSALIGNSTRLTVHGDMDLFQDGPQLNLLVGLEDLPVGEFMPYAPDDLHVTIPSGRLQVHTEFTLTTRDNATMFDARGNASLADLAVFGPDKRQVAGIKEIRVGGLAYSFPANRLDLAEVVVDRPNLVSSIDETGRINLAELFGGNQTQSQAPNPAPAKASNQTSPKDEGGGMVLNLAQARVQNGRVSFTDNSRAGSFQAVLSPLSLSVTGFSTNASRPPASIRFQAVSDTNATYDIEAKAALSPFAADIAVRLKDLLLPRYSAYFRNDILFDIPTGKTGLTARVGLKETPEGFDAEVRNGTVWIDGLSLAHRDGRGGFATLDALKLKNISFDLKKMRAALGEVEIQGGDLAVVREANGTMNLMELVPPSPEVREAAEEAAEAVQNKTFEFSVQAVNISGYDLFFEDKSPSTPFKLETRDIALKAGPFTQDLSKPLTAELDMDIGDGSLSLKAEAVPDPLKADAKFTLKNLDLSAFSSFVSADTHLALSKGRMSMDARVNLDQGKKDLRTSFAGSGEIKGLRGTDMRTGELTVAWESFRFSDLRAATAPLALSAGELVLKKPYANVIRDGNGTINLATMVKTGDEPKEAEPPAKAASAPPENKKPGLTLKIEKAVVMDGEIDFADRGVTPEYEAEIAHLNGTVAGFDSTGTKPADLVWHAKINDFATIDVSGQGAMLTGAASGAAKLRLENVGLVQFNPYSRKYLGYAIQGGKLSYSGDAAIKDRTIKAQNIIRLDNIEIGAKVNPKPVMDVPLALGVSLLKDSNGDIELDVPVSGNLDDPQFNLSKQIFQTTFKLFSQIVLAPFAFFRLDFGSAETGYVPFEPGRLDLDEKARTNLDKLSKAVRSKPGMNLSITGYADPVQDLEGAKRAAMMHKVRLLKAKALEEEGRRVRNPDQLKLDQAEYQDYLGDVYSDVVGGLSWGKDVPEMEAEIMAALPMGKEELEHFAQMRALAVRQYLSVSGQIEADRLFILQADDPAPPPAKDAPPIRADVTIKSD